MQINHRAEGCQALLGPSPALRAPRADRGGDAGPAGVAASSATQPVGFDASELHVLQTLVLQLQVIHALEEVAVAWGRKGERL